MISTHSNALREKPSTGATDAPSIELSKVNLSYQTSKGAVEAVRDLSLTVENGTFVSVLGPSGCGKSTLLQIIAGLLKASGGEVKLAGQPVSGPSTRTGVVFQKPTLLPWRSVLDNVLLPARTRGLDREKSRARAYELINLVGLDGFAERYPSELSGGMQQRVGLARALLHEPDVLLMDEPFAALDALTRERMSLDLLDFWGASKRTVFFITHSVPEATFLSDRVIVMSQRPARIVVDHMVALPRPRTLETMASAAFAAETDILRRALYSAAEGKI